MLRISLHVPLMWILFFKVLRYKTQGSHYDLLKFLFSRMEFYFITLVCI